MARCTSPEVLSFEGGGGKAVRGVHVLFADFFHQLFGPRAVFDEVADGADRRSCSRANTISSGSRAMVPSSFMISQITEAGSSPAMPARSQPASGVSGADEHAARLGRDREDVARLDDVAGLGMTGDRRLYGARPVGCGDAGGDALGGFDGDGEGGAELAAVVPRHVVDAELTATLFGQGQADQAPGMLGHEVDGFGVMNSAAMTMSPSFSRSSLSTRMTIRPALMSAMMSWDGGECAHGKDTPGKGEADPRGARARGR